MSKNNEMPSAIEGAYVVLLGQNAILFSLPIRNIVEGATLRVPHVVIGIIALITFFNVAANWVSGMEIDHDPVEYKSSHLFWDIGILGMLFSKTQILIQLCGNNFVITFKAALIVTASFYIFLCLIYIVWNNIEIDERMKRDIISSENKVSVLKTANITNIVNVIIAIFMLLLSIFTNNNQALYVAFALWFVVWLYVMYIFISGNTLFKAKTQSTSR